MVTAVQWFGLILALCVGWLTIALWLCWREVDRAERQAAVRTPATPELYDQEKEDDLWLDR